MIVADANIVAYLLLPEFSGPLADAAKDLAREDPNWVLPPLWRNEFHNILVKHLRQGNLDEDQALGRWYVALALFDGQARSVDLARALELAHRLGLSGYDAQYLALAERRNAVLVTEDRELLKKAGGLAMSMEQRLNP